MNASTSPAEEEALVGTLSNAEAEFETALREIEARVDRRMLEAADQRHAIEQELRVERYRAAELEREVERLRLELHKMAQSAAAAEAKLSTFEQMLEAVEDDINERIETVTALSVDRLSEATAELATHKARIEASLLREEADRQTIDAKTFEAQVLVDKLATMTVEAQVIADKLATIEPRAQSADRLEAENISLRGEVTRLSEQLDHIRSTWIWRTSTTVRNFLKPR